MVISWRIRMYKFAWVDLLTISLPVPESCWQCRQLASFSEGGYEYWKLHTFSWILSTFIVLRCYLNNPPLWTKTSFLCRIVDVVFRSHNFTAPLSFSLRFRDIYNEFQINKTKRQLQDLIRHCIRHCRYNYIHYTYLVHDIIYTVSTLQQKNGLFFFKL